MSGNKQYEATRGHVCELLTRRSLFPGVHGCGNTWVCSILFAGYCNYRRKQLGIVEYLSETLIQVQRCVSIAYLYVARPTESCCLVGSPTVFHVTDSCTVLAEPFSPCYMGCE